MKKQTGIWIDSSRAIVVSLTDGKEVVNEIESNVENSVHHKGEGEKGSFMGTSHVNHERKFDERKNQQIDNFLDEVSGQFKLADEVYVFGPAEIKVKLQQKIEANSELSHKLKKVETSDSMTMNQVVAKVKDFFKN